MTTFTAGEVNFEPTPRRGIRRCRPRCRRPGPGPTSVRTTSITQLDRRRCDGDQCRLWAESCRCAATVGRQDSSASTSDLLCPLDVDSRHSIACDEGAQSAPALRSLYRSTLACGIMIPQRWRARLSFKFMPKRGSDADSRIFFDQLVSLGVSRLRATGAIRLEDRHGIIAFGDKQKLIGVTHIVFENGGSWSYFICPRCGGRKKKLWLVEDAPRCLSCCWSLGVRYRSAYGFGRSERLRERDRYLDRVQDRRLRGRKRRLTMTMRRSMTTCRLAQLAHQQKAKHGSDEPLPFMRAYQPRRAAIEAIPDLKRLWKAQTTEALEQALDKAQVAILDALQSDDIRQRIIAASLMLSTRAARQRGLT
jgi:hypothetical protein